MADSFQEREKAYEARYKMDEELRFKAEVKRNKLAGLWVAEKCGMTGAAAEAYAKEVVAADFEEPGVEDVVRKLHGTCETHGLGLSKDDLRDAITRFYGEALKELAKEFPGALGADHQRVGG